MNTARSLWLTLTFLLCAGSLVAAQQNAPAESPARGSAEDQTEYLLRYKFNRGEAIRWKVVHLGTTETKISGNTQTSKSRSVSTKLWRVREVGADGSVTFTHIVENVEMWQQISDRPEVSYDSTKDATAPREYRQVAETVGQPLTTVTILPTGEIVEKDSVAPRINLGLGDIVMLLPPKPIRAGSRWYEPSELQIRQTDGRVEKIKIRKHYTLEQVRTGVATIRVKTEVLTPVEDPRVQAQLVQQLTDGTIKFDIDAGRVLAKQMDWDETVVGFNGAESMMKYLARFSEELLPDRSEATPTARAVQTVPRR